MNYNNHYLNNVNYHLINININCCLINTNNLIIIINITTTSIILIVTTLILTSTDHLINTNNLVVINNIDNHLVGTVLFLGGDVEILVDLVEKPHEKLLHVVLERAPVLAAVLSHDGSKLRRDVRSVPGVKDENGSTGGRWTKGGRVNEFFWSEFIFRRR